jgi:hypothetical protein
MRSLILLIGLLPVITLYQENFVAFLCLEEYAEFFQSSNLVLHASHVALPL